MNAVFRVLSPEWDVFTAPLLSRFRDLCRTGELEVMDGFKEIALPSYNRVGPHMNSESVTTCTRPTHAQDRQNFDGEEGETGTKSHLRQENTCK